MTLLSKLTVYATHLPDDLQNQATDFLKEIIAKIPAEHTHLFENPDFAASVAKVCACSRFIGDSWLRRPDLIPELAASGDLFSARRRDDYAQTLQTRTIDSEAALSKELRGFRRREMVRIAWRDLAGWSDLDETLADLTALAEICIQTALDFHYRQACQRWGAPTLADGSPFNIVVLGMGKLGAWELNFSSDIDLIFAYAEEGVLREKKEISYGEFFTRVCRALLKSLDEITAEGFVFRTDVRLRPFGESGPLLMTFDGMEKYYLTQAREWERYAMIKARQVAGDFHTGKQLAAMIKPFVYRRYLDYGAIEELRSLKFQIAQELKRKDRRENIKLGPGGIREVEFIGQAFQLIRGGQDAALQQREIQVILAVLEELELMPAEDAAALKYAYRFLRRVENHIQQYRDLQTHELPDDPLQQTILAFSLDFADWPNFKQELDKVRKRVQGIFEDVFALGEQDSKLQNARLIWAGNADDEQALEILASHGYPDPIATLQVIAGFRESAAVKRLSNKGLNTVQRLIPALIAGLPAVNNPDETLNRILKLFEAVAGRNVYLSLLAENPDALTQLIKLASASLWICQYLAEYPILFDELLDVRSLYDPLQKSELALDLQRALEKIHDLDEEHLMIALRQFKHLHVLRVAAADIMGAIPVMTVSDYLTWIAEAILRQVLEQAWRMLGEKYGFPPDTGSEPRHFAIIGFGKFGGLELGYGSDLDLVFLHDYPDNNTLTGGPKPIICGLFYLRLAQKIRHILDTKMLSGVLYEADLRLRPHGDSGLLVNQIGYYRDYLQKDAWTWELQALARGRFICGDPNLKDQFSAIRAQILALPRDREQLKIQVRDMRYKMREHLTEPRADIFDLKQGKGGIADIEFLVQFGILAEAAKNPALAEYTDNVRQLAALREHGFINSADAAILTQAYCGYRDYGHHQVLQGQAVTAAGGEFTAARAEVERIWQAYLG